MSKFLTVDGLRVEEIRVYSTAPNLKDGKLLCVQGQGECAYSWDSSLKQQFDEKPIEVLVTLENGQQFRLEK